LVGADSGSDAELAAMIEIVRAKCWPRVIIEADEEVARRAIRLAMVEGIGVADATDSGSDLMGRARAELSSTPSPRQDPLADLRNYIEQFRIPEVFDESTGPSAESTKSMDRAAHKR